MIGKLVTVLALSSIAACAVPAQSSPSSSAPSPAVAPGASIAGRYTVDLDGRLAVIVLADDGSATFDGEPGRWWRDGDRLMLDDGHSSAAASVDGDQLTVYTDGGALTLQRDRGDAGDAPAASGPATAAATAGPIDGRLVGCWEDYAFSTGGAGSGSRSRTITFAADGSYQTRSFISVSAGDLSSVSDEREDGTWSASEGSITVARSNAPSYQSRFELNGGLLYLGGTKFVPCS